MILKHVSTFVLAILVALSGVAAIRRSLV